MKSKLFPLEVGLVGALGTVGAAKIVCIDQF